jgi:hypothetical protein
MKTIANVNGIKVKVNLDDNKDLETFEYNILTKDIKQRIKQKKKELQKTKNTLSKFVSPIKPEIIIDKKSYTSLLRIKNSVITERSINDHRYINYLFQSLKMDELKAIAKDHNISGYSKLNHSELIEYLILNLTDEEIRDFIIENEKEIISKEITVSRQILNEEYKEILKEIRIINQDAHEIELEFEGVVSEWKTISYLIINEENIDNPERFCDCKVGNESGFCPHFWIGFIKSYQLDYFNLNDWKLTYLPINFKNQINDFKLK